MRRATRNDSQDGSALVGPYRAEYILLLEKLAARVRKNRSSCSVVYHLACFAPLSLENAVRGATSERINSWINAFKLVSLTRA